LEDVKHLGELRGQELAEKRANVDAGKKIARAAGSPIRTGVVAERLIIEGELHERGHRQGTAFTDVVGETGFDANP
jgi:hypothetical protein